MTNDRLLTSHKRAIDALEKVARFAPPNWGKSKDESLFMAWSEVQQVLLAAGRSDIAYEPVPAAPTSQQEEVVPVAWTNGCHTSVPAALRFLADYPRPSGGEQRFNAAHLYQLAAEIEKMASRPLYASPVPPDAGEPGIKADGLLEMPADCQPIERCPKDKWVNFWRKRDGVWIAFEGRKTLDGIEYRSGKTSAYNTASHFSELVRPSTSPVPADAGEPGIKALEWTQKAPPGCHEHEPFAYWAAGLGGHYRAERDGLLWMAGDEFTWQQHLTQAAAKAAAQADYEARIRSVLVPATSKAKTVPVGPVPTHECDFLIGQPVRLASPYPEMDPETVFYVTGVSWDHSRVSAHGWNITVAGKEDIEKGYGQTDGYSPADLMPAATRVA